VTSLPRPLLAVAGALLSLALLSGCSTAADGSTDAGPATPALADVTPVANPKAWEGPSSVAAPASPVEAITEPAQALPATVTDAQGTAVTVTDTSRILALDIYGSLSRIVFELGFGEQVVGRDVSSGFAEIADRPLVTENGHDLNAEAILALAPTVMVTDTSLGPWDTILQLRDTGVPVVVVDSHRSLAGTGELIGQVAAGLGVPARGDQLAARTGAEIDAAVAAIAAVAPADPAERLRIVFLYVRGQAGVYYLFGQGSGADDLVTALGGIDVSAEIGWNGMRPLTDEGLVAAAPDLVLVMTGGLESVDGVDGLLEAVPALQQTPAGQHRRVVDMPDSQILSFGPDSARVLEALAVALYAPDAAR
jgi:iron complex transport system substrate-binding protein